MTKPAAIRLWGTICFLLLLASPVDAEEGDRLALGTKEAAPFVIREADGEWSGISVRLWERLEEELGVRFEVRERTLAQLIDETASGTLDVAVSAITMTAEREERLDFSYAYFTTGLGVVARTNDSGALTTTLRRFLSTDFARSVGALCLLLAAVGFVVWLAERRVNSEEFGGSPLHGIGNGFWWSAVTMTTVGYGDKSPRSLVGRVIGFVWMFAAIIMISGFTASITSSLTVSRLEGSIRSVKDLERVSVGALDGSTSAAFLDQRGIVHTSCADVRDGVARVASGEIDAFVHDRPVLLYTTRVGGYDDVAVLPFTFQRQSYGIALPPGSPLRERMNRALLRILASDEWSETVALYLGE